MSLYFPSNASTGTQITGTNGVTYIYDGEKWIGHSSALPPGTNSITNNNKVLQVQGDGSVTFPAGAAVADDGTGFFITPNPVLPNYTLEVAAYGERVTPDDLHIFATDPNLGVTVGDSDQGSYVQVNGHINNDTIMIHAWNTARNSSWVFGVDATTEFPGYTFPAEHGESGQVLVDDGAGNLTWQYQTGGEGGGTSWHVNPVEEGCPIYAELTPEHFYAYTQKSHMRLENGGNWDIGSDFHNNHIGSFDGSTLSLSALTGNIVLNAGYDHIWTFGSDSTTTLPGNILVPDQARINSGGVGVANSAEFGTNVIRGGGNNIINSQIYMGSGTGEFRSMTYPDNPSLSGKSLIYAGVENPGFAGLIASDDNIYSEYAITVDDMGFINIGGTSVGYTAALGVSTGCAGINGIAINMTETAIVGGSMEPSNMVLDDTGVRIKTLSGANVWHFTDEAGLVIPGQIRNQSGTAVAFIDQVPVDINQLTDNSNLLNPGYTDINIDGGGALSFYASSLLSADGGYSSSRFGRGSRGIDGGGAGGTHNVILNGGGA